MEILKSLTVKFPFITEIKEYSISSKIIKDLINLDITYGQDSNILKTRVMFRLARYYFDENKLDKMRELITDVLKDGNQMTILYVVEAFSESLVEEYLIAYYYDNVVNNWRDVDSLYFLGQYYKIKKEYDLMMQYFLTGVELNHANSMYSMAVFHRFRNEHEDAAKYYGKAIENNHILAKNDLKKLSEKMPSGESPKPFKRPNPPTGRRPKSRRPKSRRPESRRPESSEQMTNKVEIKKEYQEIQINKSEPTKMEISPVAQIQELADELKRKFTLRPTDDLLKLLTEIHECMDKINMEHECIENYLEADHLYKLGLWQSGEDKERYLIYSAMKDYLPAIYELLEYYRTSKSYINVLACCVKIAELSGSTKELDSFFINNPNTQFRIKCHKLIADWNNIKLKKSINLPLNKKIYDECAVCCKSYSPNLKLKCGRDVCIYCFYNVHECSLC